MKIKNQVTRVFCIISFLILLTGFCGVARAADQKTLEDTERLIKQQQEQLKAQEKALEDLKARVEALSKEAATAKETAAETEKSAQETGKELRIAKAHDDTPVRMAKGVDVSKEEDRAGDAKGHSFGVPKTDTVITISGYVKADVIHDFDKIASPYKFVTKDIVVNGVPSGQPSSRTTFTANTSRLIFGSATPTDIGKLSTFISFDFAKNTTSSDPEFRLRQAWGQLDDFFLGGGCAPASPGRRGTMSRPCRRPWISMVPTAHSRPARPWLDGSVNSKINIRFGSLLKIRTTASETGIIRVDGRTPSSL